jgi:hypothetical protein
MLNFHSFIEKRLEKLEQWMNFKKFDNEQGEDWSWWFFREVSWWINLKKWENGWTTYTKINLAQIPQRIRTMASLRKRTMVEHVRKPKWPIIPSQKLDKEWTLASKIMVKLGNRDYGSTLGRLKWAHFCLRKLNFKLKKMAMFKFLKT